MSTWAVSMVRDEADVIEPVLRHMLGQVDHVIVADNRSVDATTQILVRLAEEFHGRLQVRRDDQVGYWQADKMTALVREISRFGARWAVPFDADEWWYAPDGRRIADWLAGLAPDVAVVHAGLYNHVPTGVDLPDETNPVRRIGWRIRERGALPKVAVRALPTISIHQGNHGADGYGTGQVVDGLVIRHFPWRTEEQYVRKIRNGEEAYAATSLPDDVGAHWRMFAGQPDDAIRAHFLTWFHFDDPAADETLIYDPAPGA